mmetsp:Transcript_33774/g.88750  ORF Transcript_33774/g.88750 Transcript_33774/m.88750 type:complete len:244 (-) Transcript_33774:14-745(-)
MSSRTPASTSETRSRPPSLGEKFPCLFNDLIQVQLVQSHLLHEPLSDRVCRYNDGLCTAVERLGAPHNLRFGHFRRRFVELAVDSHLLVHHANIPRQLCSFSGAVHLGRRRPRHALADGLVRPSDLLVHYADVLEEGGGVHVPSGLDRVCRLRRRLLRHALLAKDLGVAKVRDAVRVELQLEPAVDALEAVLMIRHLLLVHHDLHLLGRIDRLVADRTFLRLRRFPRHLGRILTAPRTPPLRV